MATFFGHAPPPAASQPPTADQPIKMQGFPLPPLPGAPTPHSSSSSAASLQASEPLAAFAHLYPHLIHQPHLQHHLGHPPQPGQGPGIDPSILLGLTHHDLASHSHYGSLATGAFGGATPGTSVLSDADLDFESVLASLGAAAHQQQQQQQQQQHGRHHQPHTRAVYGSHDAHTDIFAAGGMFDQAAMHPPPLNDQQQQQQLSPRLQLDRMPSYFTQHAAPPQQQQPPPPHTHESFPSPALPSSSSSAKPAERGRGTSSKRSASTERTGRTGRTASTGTAASGGGSVGKAPRQSRSRSARRSSSAAGYDRDRPSPTSRESGGRRGAAAAAAAASGAGEEGADPSPAATPGGGAGATNGAIGIPAASSSSAKATEQAAQHQYAMSLPAYPSASLSGTPSSVPGGAGGGAWGALAAAHPHAFPAHAFNSASPNGGGGQQQQADPATGWRPSPPPGAAASAPPATGLAGRSPTAGGGVKALGKKGKGLADVQEEDDGKGDQLSEKRRKRRESHNAVERRRRDNINDRIAELSLLVPDTFLVPGSPPPDGSVSGACMLPPVDEGPASPAIGALSLMSPGPSSAAVLSGSPASAPGAGFATRASAQQQQQPAAEKLSAQQLAAKEKPNKGVVLAKSVEYIKYLQQMVELSQQHAVELQRQNAALRDALASSSSSSQHQHAQHSHRPASTSFPNPTAASSSFSAPATDPTGSPASPNAHARSNGAATGASVLGLALEPPNSNGGGAVPSGSFFDFGPASEHGQGGDEHEHEHEDADGLDEREEEERGRAGGGGRSARAGERAWTPMLEGLDMDGLAALKEEDMDQS